MIGEAGEGLAKLKNCHVQLSATGYRLRTSYIRPDPARPGRVTVKLTWCRRRNPAVVVKRSARMTDVEHLDLIGWLMGAPAR